MNAGTKRTASKTTIRPNCPSPDAMHKVSGATSGICPIYTYLGCTRDGALLSGIDPPCVDYLFPNTAPTTPRREVPCGSILKQKPGDDPGFSAVRRPASFPIPRQAKPEAPTGVEGCGAFYRWRKQCTAFMIFLQAYSFWASS